MGFFTNPKLLNTAVTRARFRVFLVGDPRALCGIGECKPCWKFILRYCEMYKTFNYKMSYNEMISSIELTSEESEGKEEDFGESSDFTFIEKFDDLVGSLNATALSVPNTSSFSISTKPVDQEKLLDDDSMKRHLQNNPINDLNKECLKNDTDSVSSQSNSPRKSEKRPGMSTANGSSPFKHHYNWDIENESLARHQREDESPPSIGTGNDSRKKESLLSRFFPNLSDNTNQTPDKGNGQSRSPDFWFSSSIPTTKHQHIPKSTGVNGNTTKLDNYPPAQIYPSISDHSNYPTPPSKSSAAPRRTYIEEDEVIETIQASRAIPSQSQPGFYDQMSFFQQQPQQPTMIHPNFFHPGVRIVQPTISYNMMQQQQPYSHQQPFGVFPRSQYVRFIRQPIRMLPCQPVSLGSAQFHEVVRHTQQPQSESLRHSPINSQGNQLHPTSSHLHPHAFTDTLIPQHSAKQLILLPAKSMVTLRHKIQFIHEYCLHALGYAGPEAESLKEYIKRSTMSAFQDVDSLENMPELLVEKMSVDIQLKMESNYSFVHDHLVEVISRDVKPPQSNISASTQLLGDMKKRQSALQSEIEAEEEPRTDKIRSVYFLLRLIKHELDVCEKLLVVESQQSLYLQIILSFVEVKIKEIGNLVGVPLRHSPSHNTDDDKDSRYWFARRRNDPYVREYQAAYDRRMAPRLPSPTPPESTSDYYY